MKSWKEITQYTTAVVSLTSGIILTYIQYFDSGDVSNGVLGYVALTLMYAAAIFGVTMYWNGKYLELNLKWNAKYDELRSLITHGNDNLLDSSSKKAA